MKNIKSILIESQQMDRFANARGKGGRSKSEEKSIAGDSNLFFKFIYKEWSFQATIHAAAQEYDRRPDMLEADWKDFHKRVYDKLVKMKPINGEFIFFSKKFQQAYVAAVDFQTNSVRIITVLPKGRSNPKPGTIRMIIEGKQYDLEVIECE
jgi:hypothetical protein